MPEPSGPAPNPDRQVDEDSTAELDRVVSVEVDGVTLRATRLAEEATHGGAGLLEVA